MRFRNRLLQLLAATVALPGCPPTGDCPESESGTSELVEPLAPALQALVDRCRAAGTRFDEPECIPMCRELIIRDLGAPPDDEISVCALRDDTNPASAVTANVSWTIGPRCVGGRRPVAYAASRADRQTVGGFLAEQARLEAASVRAFLELAHALAFHRAPRVLVDACRRAAADEIVHAVVIGRLARAHGVVPQIEDAQASAIPSLEQLALANAVEGCVRETWGAAVATWQAHAAADPAIRAAMRRIAPDETKHATLSRAIDRWALRRLDAAARTRVTAVRAAAVIELTESATCEVPCALAERAGLPRPEIATNMLGAMATASLL